MKKSINTVFPFGLICASLLFFFNPNVQLVDVLPDLFGYILLVKGLYYLADLNEAIGEARARFMKKYFVEVAKLIVFLMVFGGLVSPQEQSNFILVATLSFGVIELLILIPATRSLFAGLMQLATKFGSEAIFAVKPKKIPEEPAKGFKKPSKKRTFEKKVAQLQYRNSRLRCALEKLQTLTLAFVFLKPLVALLPEFSALSGTEYNEGLVNYYGFVGLFRGFGFVVLLPFAIVWLCRTWKFLGNLRRDTAFCEACLTQYSNEILPKTDLFVQRAVKTALSVIALGMFFSLDFYVEYYNVIPDVLCAIFVMVGVFLLRKYINGYKPVLYIAAGYGVMTLISNAMTVWFNTQYYFNAIYKNAAAELVFYGEGVATVLENFLFLWMLWKLMKLMEQMIVRYSGFSVTSDKAPGASERISRVHVNLKKTLYQFFGFGALMAATGILYEFLKPTVPYIWLIDFAVAVIYIYLFYRSTWEIREQVEYKYLLS